MHDPKKAAALIIAMGHPHHGDDEEGGEVGEEAEECAAGLGHALQDFIKSDTPETRKALYHAFAAMQEMTDHDEPAEEGEGSEHEEY